MEEKNLEFDLDDILKEFGTQQEEEPAQEAPAQQEVPAEEEPAQQEEPIPETQEETVTADTIRLDDIAQAVQVSNPSGYEPVEEEDEEEVQPPEEEPQEAFEDGWEPVYDQPMGDYIPPEPIVFRPRSRLHELKRKLIEGPEKRYSELTEMGVAKLKAAIFLCFIVVLLSAAATVLHAMGYVPENRLRLMVFIQFFAMMVSALLGSYQLLDGVADLFRKRFSLNTLLVFTFIACCADGVFGLREQRIPCCAAFSLEMLMSLWSAYHKRTIELGQMDTLRRAVRLDGVCKMADYYEENDGLLRREAQVEDFMDVYNKPTDPEKTQGRYGIVALCVSIAAAAVAVVLHNISFGVQVLAVSLLAAVPASSFISVSRPMALLEKRLHKLGSLICGWQGVASLSGKVVFPLHHTDLFPLGSCKMNGVKFYGERDPDEVVAYATALITAEDGGLAPLFTHLLDSRNGRHYDVQELHTYGNGGIGCVVNDEPVLAGDLAFMKTMGVEVPEGVKVEQAVYVAIDGELCGLFAITYTKSRSSASGLATLCSYKGLRPILTSNDFMQTETFVRSKFNLKSRRLLFPEPAVRTALSAKELPEDAQVCAVTTEQGLAPVAYAVSGSRALKAAAKAGVGIHMAGGILGLVMMAALAVLGAQQLLTPLNLFLYELVWMIPGILATEWTRSV